MTEGKSHWLVNSYSYPNPFSSEKNAQQAWETLLPFYDYSSYSKLKEYWQSAASPRRLSAHAVESWKATFEEFGLLYVPSGSDEVRITPAGNQFRNAADNGQKEEFAWIGLNLLLRYPLRGPRGRRGLAYQQSDLLLYWFLYAALSDLQGYVWWSELERVLCTVFRVEEAQNAIQTVMDLRSERLEVSDVRIPVRNTRGAFYNSLNQIIVHAGMYYLVLGEATDSALYDVGLPERRHWILPEWVPMVETALGGKLPDIDCNGDLNFVARMPKAPDFDPDEDAYFEYAGAAIPSAQVTLSVAPVDYVPVPGGTVPLLREGSHYSMRPSSPPYTELSGPITVLCRLARGQRVILSHNLNVSYIVQEKTRVASDQILVVVRSARPITNSQLVHELMEAYGA